jgi:hypothetical protein
LKKKCQRKRGSERENGFELDTFMEYALLSFRPFEFKEKQ